MQNLSLKKIKINAKTPQWKKTYQKSNRTSSALSRIVHFDLSHAHLALNRHGTLLITRQVPSCVLVTCICVTSTAWITSGALGTSLCLPWDPLSFPVLYAVTIASQLLTKVLQSESSANQSSEPAMFREPSQDCVCKGLRECREAKLQESLLHWPVYLCIPFPLITFVLNYSVLCSYWFLRGQPCWGAQFEIPYFTPFSMAFDLFKHLTNISPGMCYFGLTHPKLRPSSLKPVAPALSPSWWRAPSAPSFLKPEFWSWPWFFTVFNALCPSQVLFYPFCCINSLWVSHGHGPCLRVTMDIVSCPVVQPSVFDTDVSPLLQTYWRLAGHLPWEKRPVSIAMCPGPPSSSLLFRPIWPDDTMLWLTRCSPLFCAGACSSSVVALPPPALWCFGCPPPCSHDVRHMPLLEDDTDSSGLR